MIPAPALLFCPADRPERYAKAVAAADGVIIDLEDAVAPADKAAAREALIASGLDPATTIVRVNPVETSEHPLDLDALGKTPYRTIMLAKSESAEQLTGLAGFSIIALIETARGVENVSEIARHPTVTALMWGAEDLIASLGGRSSRFEDGTYRDVARLARARTLLAARANGKHTIDSVHLDIADVEGLRAEARDGAASGFTATACIHPSQVEIIRAEYTATPEEITWAERVLDEATRQPGAFRYDGQMIDEPVLRQARSILASR
ncbi:MAG: CoA ester lyase [Microbacterium sp.]